MHGLFTFLSEKQTCCSTLAGLVHLEGKGGGEPVTVCHVTLGSKERVFADSIHVCVQCKGRLGKFEQQGLMVKCRFYFVLCFFCSSELPSKLSSVPKLWVFPSMCNEKS